jgi:hypothetical protein
MNYITIRIKLYCQKESFYLIEEKIYSTENGIFHDKLDDLKGLVK